MDIVGPVASVAVRWQDDFRDIFRSVAGVAVQRAVRACQWIFGLMIVVEAPTRPTIRVVAKRAIGAQPTDMVRIFVAARACNRSVLERRGSMALLTRHDRMPADQWKSR